MRDLGKELVQAALDQGLISATDVKRVKKLVKESGGRAYAAQVLVRERMISCNDLLTLQNNLQAKVYECPSCKKRFPKDAIPEKKRKAFRCKGCDKKVYLEEASLSRLEVLTSRDPLDLTISLREAGEVSVSSEVSAIDLERYEVGEELGRGGYGVVFKAFHKDLQRDVALKVLRPTVNLPRVTLERFIREGRSASRLKHPNVVSVYDIGRSKDLYALAMEFVPGRALKAVIKEREKIPWAESCALMDEILAGVGHAHEKGIIHRDLKPTNIIIEEGSGRPRIIDFGLAKDLDADVQLTQAGAIVGTPFYLSPEQIEGRSAKVDGRSDVFALGVILYFMICGERPFQSKLKSEVYAKILNEDPIDPSELVPELPAEVEAVILKAMEKDREDRWADVGEMRTALAEAVEAAEDGGRRTTRKRKRTTRTQRRVPAKTDSRRARRTTRQVPTASGGLPTPVKAGLAVGAFVIVFGFLALTSGGGAAETADEPEVAVTPTEPDRPDRPESEPRPDRPEPEPKPEPEAEPEPEPEPEPESEPEPEPEPLAAGPGGVDPDAPAEPAKPVRVDPKPPPSPSPVALDRGERDAKEFPDLAERAKDKWVGRAFFINALAEVAPPRPYAVRGLRFALNDRFPLNRAFALRGLARVQDGGFLRAYGSQALFDALRDLLGEGHDEPYVRNTCQLLLGRMAGSATQRSPSQWKDWWKDEGQALFEESARRPPDVRAPVQDAEQARQLTSQTRKGFNVFSKLRKKGLDLYFVLDVTLSMTDELDRMRKQVTEITSFMQLLLEKKVRLGYVTFGDKVVQQVPLTGKLSQFVRSVEEIKIFNDPNDRSVEEAVSLGLEAALTKGVGWQKRRARRTILLLGDAPPLDLARTGRVADAAGKLGIVINGIIAKPPAKYASRWPPKPAFEDIASRSGGTVAELDRPEELITRILMLSLGGSQEEDLRRFVYAYRDVTGGQR